MPMPIVPSLPTIQQLVKQKSDKIIYNFSIDRMGMGGNGNSPHGNPMGMGISQKLGNGGGREWELNRWEWEGMGMLKAIPAHL